MKTKKPITLEAAKYKWEHVNICDSITQEKAITQTMATMLSYVRKYQKYGVDYDLICGTTSVVSQAFGRLVNQGTLIMVGMAVYTTDYTERKLDAIKWWDGISYHFKNDICEKFTDILGNERKPNTLTEDEMVKLHERIHLHG